MPTMFLCFAIKQSEKTFLSMDEISPLMKAYLGGALLVYHYQLQSDSTKKVACCKTILRVSKGIWRDSPFKQKFMNCLEFQRSFNRVRYNVDHTVWCYFPWSGMGENILWITLNSYNYINAFQTYQCLALIPSEIFACTYLWTGRE